jgi:hypothetical protein
LLSSHGARSSKQGRFVKGYPRAVARVTRKEAKQVTPALAASLCHRAEAREARR